MDVPSSDLQIIKEALKEHAESSFKKYNLLKELNLSKDEYNPLKNLSLLKNIIIYKQDMKNSVFLLNHGDYIKKWKI